MMRTIETCSYRTLGHVQLSLLMPGICRLMKGKIRSIRATLDPTHVSHHNLILYKPDLI